MANDRECHHSMWPMYENDDLVRTKIIIKTSRENLQFCHSLLFLWFSLICGNNKNISSLQWQQASLTFTASRWVLRQVNKYKCIPVTKVLAMSGCNVLEHALRGNVSSEAHILAVPCQHWGENRAEQHEALDHCHQKSWKGTFTNFEVLQ